MGHFASVYTHIDDFVESTRLLTPQGVMESRRLPGSGAGPSADRMVLGSEGILGVVTQAWVRLQSLPRWKSSVTVAFKSLAEGAEAVRLIAQSGLFPSNCRLLDEAEVRWNGLAPEPCALLVLGFESADHPVSTRMERALEIAVSQGGIFDEASYTSPEETEHPGMDRSPTPPIPGAMRLFACPITETAWWALALSPTRLKLPSPGTSSTPCTTALQPVWNKAIRDITGEQCVVSCRFTHVYPDGPAPYFTFFAVGDRTGDLRNALEKWRRIKAAANHLVVAYGGDSHSPPCGGTGSSIGI